MSLEVKSEYGVESNVIILLLSKDVFASVDVINKQSLYLNQYFQTSNYIHSNIIDTSIILFIIPNKKKKKKKKKIDWALREIIKRKAKIYKI